MSRVQYKVPIETRSDDLKLASSVPHVLLS